MTGKDAPILEYDPAREAVIGPTHGRLALTLPERAVFAFLGDTIDEYARERGLRPVAEFVSITKRYPVYTARTEGRDIALCQAPVGAPAAAQIMDWMIGYGVRQIVSAGSCGAIADLPENAFLLPARALRDEGTSYHYLPAARFVGTDAETRRTLHAVLEERGLPVQECVTWTTDGFYRETPDKVRARREEGCACVEMECAALAAVARFRGARFAQLLFTADSLADTSAYAERGWGGASLRPALEICLSAAARLRTEE